MPGISRYGGTVPTVGTLLESMNSCGQHF
jgi:hypothetical protein